MTAPSEYVLAALREGADFTLYRGRRRGDQSAVLVVALTAEQPSPQDLRRLEHEYSLATELNAAWAANPLELPLHEGRTVLILKDPGGEPLDRILELERGQRLNLIRFLRISINLTRALQAEQRVQLAITDFNRAE